MKIIEFSAGVIGHNSNVDRIVKAIMEETGHETEFVKLTELDFSACKGCVQLCVSLFLYTDNRKMVQICMI